MTFRPILAHEARGDSQPMRRACLEALHSRGLALLRNAQMNAPLARPNGPTLRRILDAHEATCEPWGGVTIDLATGQPVVRTSGYAVSTGGNASTGYHHEIPVGTPWGMAFAQAVRGVALRAPGGQYLGVFHDADKGTIDIDTVYLTDSRDDAIAVGVACHSTGGAYDFVTGDGVWMPHLAE